MKWLIRNNCTPLVAKRLPYDARNFVRNNRGRQPNIASPTKYRPGSLANIGLVSVPTLCP